MNDGLVNVTDQVRSRILVVEAVPSIELGVPDRWGRMKSTLQSAEIHPTLRCHGRLLEPGHSNACRAHSPLYRLEMRARDGDFRVFVIGDLFIRPVFSTFYKRSVMRPCGVGSQFRRVTYPDDTRRGILGQGSMLVQTSLANRTSPVLRGKWVMEVLLGSPPPPPPPNVPGLEETKAAGATRMLTVRERMEQHRANPACRSCHRVIDPLGLALENFDVTGGSYGRAL
jgi:hypothetical protein